MRKILIYSAIATGCIAPAIFTLAQYANAINSSESQSMQIIEKSVPKKIIKQTPAKLCIASVMKEYNEEKAVLAKGYQKKLREALLSARTSKTLSGEKGTSSPQFTIIQGEYKTSLEELKQKYLIKQRNCLKK